MVTPENLPYAGPLYQQVYQIIRSRILSGRWDSLRALPGEVDLARELRVSIGTVRKAMEQLARDHMVVRERGRGTFIQSGSLRQVPEKFAFFNLRSEPIHPTIVLIDARLVDASPGQTAALKLKQSASTRSSVFEIVRNWVWEDQIVCREKIAVEATRFPGLPQVMKSDVEALHATYADVYGVKVGGLIWSLGPFSGPQEAEPTADQSEFFVSRLAIDSRSFPVEYCEKQIVRAGCRVRFGTIVN